MGAERLRSPLQNVQEDKHSKATPKRLAATLEDETCDDSSDEEESLLSYQEHSVSGIVYESASLIIDTLYQLSFRIRTSTIRPRFSKSQPTSQVNKDNWVNPEEDRQLEDNSSSDSGIYHQTFIPSQGNSNQIDKNDMHENKIDDNEFDNHESNEKEPDDIEMYDNTKGCAIDTPRFMTTSETRQIIPSRFESSPQGVNKSTSSRRNKEILDYPYPGLEPDSALLYQGGSNSNTLVSVIRQPNSSLSNSDKPLLTTPAVNVSFYVLVDGLEPNYQAQNAQHGSHGYWSPPTIRTGYIQRSRSLFNWRGGLMTPIIANEVVNHPLGRIHSAATIFTQNPDTPHLLVVPFDARTGDVYRYPGGWRPLSFNHVRIENTQCIYSAVSAGGNRQHIASRGSSHWMPQLLPSFYDDQSRSTRVQAGLIGSLPLLIALAAFSAPATFLQSVLTNCLRPQKWHPHQYQYPAGRKLQNSVGVPV